MVHKDRGNVSHGEGTSGVRTNTACARSKANGPLVEFGHHCIRIRCAPQSGEAELCFADDGCVQLRRALMEERRRAAHRRGAVRQTAATLEHHGLTVQRQQPLLSVANVVRMAWRLPSQCGSIKSIDANRPHTHTRARLSAWWSGLDDAGGPRPCVTLADHR